MKITILYLVLLAIALIGGHSDAADPLPGAPASGSKGAATQPDETPEVLTPAPLELLSGVQKRLRSINTLEATFVEEKKLAIVKHTLTIRGHFAIQSPDRAIWVVNDPVRYAIRIEGEEVRQWDEDTKKVQVAHLGGNPAFKAVSEQLQAWVLGNYQALAQSYDVFVFKEKPLSLRFVPKAGTMVAKMVNYIDLIFREDGKDIDRLAIAEVGGDRTTLHVTGAVKNQTIEDATWEIPPR